MNISSQMNICQDIRANSEIDQLNKPTLLLGTRTYITLEVDTSKYLIFFNLGKNYLHAQGYLF